MTFTVLAVMIVMCVTWFYGCWWLPTFLYYLNFDYVKLGKHPEEEDVYVTKSTRFKDGKVLAEDEEDDEVMKENAAPEEAEDVLVDAKAAPAEVAIAGDEKAEAVAGEVPKEEEAARDVNP